MGYPALQADSLPAELFILYLSLPVKLIYIYYSPWGHKELDMTERLSTAQHTHNGILLSHKKNKIMSLAVTWIHPVMIILSEVSQKKKEKYYMISLVRGI